MEVHVVPGGDGGAVERGGLVVPAAKSSLDLFVDAVADRLHNLGVDDAALGVNGDFDDDVTDQIAGELGAVDGRIGIHGGIGDVDFMACYWPVNHGAQRRSGASVVVTCFGVGDDSRRLRDRLGRLGSQARLRRSRREQQFGHVGRGEIAVRIRRKVNQLVAIGAVSEGKPCGTHIDDPGMMERNGRQ